ncbi:MAG: hypothetical protein ACXAC6_17575 [Candidatus Hodarchaeales archaeon]|jgi:hypothetical protein
MKSEIEIKSEISIINDMGRGIIHAVNNKEEYDLDEFDNSWNKYIEEGGKVTESMRKCFDSIFGLTMNQLVRIREKYDDYDWRLLNLENLPGVIRHQLRKKERKKESVYR